MASGPVIVLIDGEHDPAAVRDVLDRLERERGVAGVLFCGGEEKLRRGVLERPVEHYGRPVEAAPPEEGLRRLAAGAAAVVDLADEPALPPSAKAGLAALALHLGLDFESPGARLAAPRYGRAPFDGPVLGVIGTGKRTGKTAVAGHWAALLRDRGARPVIVCMGRGGPAPPELADPAGLGVEELLARARQGRHAASDHLEDALLAGVPTVGCRRVGGGPAGEPAESNVDEGAGLAAGLEPSAIVLEGSGAAIPPLEADRTVCVVGDRPGGLEGLGTYRLLRAELALVRGDAALAEEVSEHCPAVLRFELRPEPAEPLPAEARVALFSTSPALPEGLEPVVRSQNLARRGALEEDLERATEERCDTYLTELKAAAIDTVAEHAVGRGAKVVFVRNRPVGVDGDLDAALVKLWLDA